MLAQRVRQSYDEFSTRNDKPSLESRPARGGGASHGGSWVDEDIHSRVERNVNPFSRPRSGSASFSRSQTSAAASAMTRSESDQRQSRLTTSSSMLAGMLRCSSLPGHSDGSVV